MLDPSAFVGTSLMILDLETDRLIPPTRDLSTLELTIGAVWDYRTMALSWFDVHALPACLDAWTQDPLLFVTHNGKRFDFPILTQHFRRLGASLATLAAWEQVCRQSFDLLDAIWTAAPADRWKRGLHGLNALSLANGLGSKQAPQDDMPALWQRGQIATVCNHCQEDILILKALFELGYARGGMYQRGHGIPVTVTLPDLSSWSIAKESYA